VKEVKTVEDLGDKGIALGPHFEVTTCDRYRLKTIIRLTSTRQATNLYTIRESEGRGRGKTTYVKGGVMGKLTQ